MVRYPVFFFLFLIIMSVYVKGQDTLALFNGVSLEGWEVTYFYFQGHGNVYINDSCIILEKGSTLMTGITWTGDYPVNNYEIILEAMRMEGNDFFCGLTFPVHGSFCSLILGGWGGSVIGLSSIDGYDAYNNVTRDHRNFKNGRWYDIRLRVTDDKIEAWLDNSDKLVDFKIEDNNRLSVRWEVEPSRPLGIATFQTTGVLRNIKLVTFP